jgi:hypothetical protein
MTYHFGRLIFNLSPSELFHRHVVNGDHLDGQKPFKPISRDDSMNVR